MVSPTSSAAARVLHQRKAAMIVGLSIAFLTECGCATARPAIKSLWNQVPPVRWSGKGHETAETTAQPDKPAEPAMAANVALKTDQASEPDPQVPAPPNSRRSSSALSRFGSRINRTETRPKDAASIPEVVRSDDSETDGLVEADRSDSSMERLNAALTDDIAQANSLPQRSVTSLDARIKVDSLLTRAKQLFEIGQLEQAHQTALTAQEISDASQIDFFPDEDRPVDLIRRIEGQLKESRMNDDPDSGRHPTESQAGQEGPKTFPNR